jgi:hypothetical protein
VRQRENDTRDSPAIAKQQLAVAGTPGSGWKVTGDGGRWRHAVGDDFELFTEMPLAKFYKLLSNFLKKLKICKNKSCSIFQVLQLSQCKHFQIRPIF